MSRRRNTLLAGALVALLVSATSIILISRASTTKPIEPILSPKSTTRPRNLSLRPEALGVSRQLGNRFKSINQGISTVVGTLSVNGEQQPLVLMRRQTDSGETVEMQIGDRNLRWNEKDSLTVTNGSRTKTDRLLAERLILDSPDQFVLAQLRGAGYFTVARNVRPVDAGADYSGPIWNIVRVDEPEQQDENVRAISTWRLFYINIRTGLPDHIEYQLDGQDIRTDFGEWSEQNGEQTPTRVTWSSGGQVIMEFTARHVSHNQ